MALYWRIHNHHTYVAHDGVWIMMPVWSCVYVCVCVCVCVCVGPKAMALTAHVFISDVCMLVRVSGYACNVRVCVCVFCSA